MVELLVFDSGKKKVEVAPPPTDLVARFDSETQRLREFLVANPTSGYVVLVYRREDADTVHTEGGYWFNDVMDKFWLPDYAKEKIRNLLWT